MAKCIMVQGTMSGAGKSLLCAALCRIFKEDGLRAAPFKSQNMALNSYVTLDGLEMGRAQVMQAQAAGVEPDVRMNPILLKPCSDTGSQIIVNGEVRGQMPAAEYFRYKTRLIPDILAAYHSLAETCDVIVIEGAGSPAEINLKENDIVNMGLAKLVDAPVLLAGDIDRGGVFAQLYGTVALLEPEERARIRGLIINKFRGDEAILRPGLTMLEEKTGIPVLGVVPYLQVDVDDEDSLAPSLTQTAVHKPLDVAVIRLPRISNFTDFAPLEAHPLFGVRYVPRPEELGAPDLLILPGTKSTMSDLLWLRQSGLEAAVQKRAAEGTLILGVCGGYQMLGGTLSDPTGAEGDRPQTLRGLGLLPVDTVFDTRKTRTNRRLRDPHRPHYRKGRTVLPPAGRDTGWLRCGPCVRYLSPRPVRLRRPDRGAGPGALSQKGNRLQDRRAREPLGLPESAVRQAGCGCAGGAGYGRDLPNDGGMTHGTPVLGRGQGQDHRRHGAGAAGTGRGPARGHCTVPEGGVQQRNTPAGTTGCDHLPG